MNLEEVQNVIKAIETNDDKKLYDLIFEFADEDIKFRLEKAEDIYREFKVVKSNILSKWTLNLSESQIKWIILNLNEKSDNTIDAIGQIFGNEKYIEQIIKIGRDNHKLGIKVLKKAGIEFIKESIIKHKDDILPIIEDNDNIIRQVWDVLGENYQQKRFEEIVKKLKLNPYALMDFLKKTNIEVLEEKIIQYAKKDPDYLTDIWMYIENGIKVDFIIPVLEVKKDDDDFIDFFEEIILHSDTHYEEPYFEKIMELVQYDYKYIEILWKSLEPNSKLNQFENICNILKEKDENNYRKFVNDYMGNVEFDENNNPIIPQDLKTILFDKKAIEHYASKDIKILKELEKNLPGIIEKWNEIKQNIQYKKANGIINDKMELRTNFEMIVNAYKTIEKIKPTTISEIEFCNLPGAEKVGEVAKFTSHMEIARYRAFRIANAIDMSPKTKKFPDFSLQDGEFALKVFPPRDKRPMLMGFDANCCFRPNGNADSSGNRDNSLYKYALTSAYAGVFEAGKIDPNSGNLKSIYVGSPFFVNGNILAINSYETANSRECKRMNDLIIKGAIEAIEKSNGAISFVIMGSLHKGEGRLDIDKKICVGDYFKLYTENEYSGYSELSYSIKKEQYLIAAKIGDKILYGEELYEWCIKECGGDIKEIEKKLGLKFGSIQKEYEFAEDGNIVYKKQIIKPDFVEAFSKEYDRLKYERSIMSYILKVKKLNKQEKLSEEDSEILRFFTEKLKQVPDNIISKFSHLTIQELKKELENNWESMYKIYCGVDLKLIAKCYGIDEIKFKELVETRARQRAEQEVKKGKDEGIQSSKKVNIETSKQKREKGKLISNIKKKGNVKLNALIVKIQKGTLTKKDYETLENAGIDTIRYKESLEVVASIYDIEKSKNDKIEQKFNKYVKDEDFIKNVLIEELIGQIKAKTITEEVIKKTNLTINNIVRDKIIKDIKKENNFPDEIEFDEERSQELNERFKEAILGIDTIIKKIDEKGVFSREEQEFVEKFEEEYEVSISEVYKSFRDNEKKVINDIAKQRFNRLQSYITIGIEERESIKKIMSLIKGEEIREYLYGDLMYGENWYIAINNDSIDTCINENASDKERKKVQEILLNMIETEENEEKRKIIEKKYKEMFAPQNGIGFDD